MAEVFLSFIHEEEDWTKETNQFIEGVFPDQIDSFFSSDENAIYAGDDWMTRIFDELKQSKVLVSMLSPQSISRPWINFEAGAAWMRDTKVIPVCFGGLSIEKLPKPYSSLQAIDLETYEGSFYLVSSIAHHLELPAPKKPIFASDGARLALSTTDPEGNAKLFAPYKRLQAWMRAFKDVTKPPEPGPVTWAS